MSMERKLFVTETDKKKLKDLVSYVMQFEADDHDIVKILDEELSNAETIEEKRIPGNMVTMNTTVLIGFGDQDETLTVVYPEDADVSANKISVLSPIGMAILGFKKGDVIDREVPGGVAHMIVKEIICGKQNI